MLDMTTWMIYEYKWEPMPCKLNYFEKVEYTMATFGFGVWRLAFYFFLARVCETCGYCSCTVQWIVAAKFDFSPFFQSINAHRVLFTDPQISLFSNFFIKNRSHGTIYTFKYYFATVFFSFQFQFSVFSCIQTDPKPGRPKFCTSRKKVKNNTGEFLVAIKGHFQPHLLPTLYRLKSRVN